MASENDYHKAIIFFRFLLTLYHKKIIAMCKEYINRIKIALAEQNKPMACGKNR